MATKRKCKNGRLRSGKGCRKTKCPRKLTKQGFCPKGASRRSGKKTKRKGSGGGESKLLRALRAQARFALGHTSRMPSGLIGTDVRPRPVQDILREADAAAARRAVNRRYEGYGPDVW